MPTPANWGLLARHWPEATRLMSGVSATLAGALAQWGGPAALAADRRAARTPRRLGGHYLSDAKIAALIESAKATGGVPTNAWETRELKELARKWLYFNALRWMRDPAVKPRVRRKKDRDGGKGMRALVGAMRRLALAAWNVAARGEAFDAKRLFPGPAPAAKAKATTAAPA